MNIAAIIVTYFPTEDLLERLLRCIYGEVEKVYVIDNTSSGSLVWLTSEWFSMFQLDIDYHALGDNFGIAKAQNIGIDLAIKNNSDHVIFFDQDSEPQEEMISKLANAELKLLADDIKVGSVGPIYFDKKTNRYAPSVRHAGIMVHKIEISPYERKPVAADYLISSGSLIRLSILHEVGYMREELFIDWVDVEWGLRAGINGCKHFIIPDAAMAHSIGDESISLVNKEINLHSDIRNYYIVRNACYLLSDKSVNWQWRVSIIFKIPKYVIFYSMTTTSKNRAKAFYLLVTACIDGFSGRVGKAF